VLLVPAEEQRGAAMGTVGSQQTDPAGGITEGDEVFTEDADSHRRAIGLRQLAREQRGDPERAEEVPHRGAGANVGQEIVFLGRQHLPPNRGSVAPGAQTWHDEMAVPAEWANDVVTIGAPGSRGLRRSGYGEFR